LNLSFKKKVKKHLNKTKMKEKQEESAKPR